ncbi:hypothetical protein EG358_06690 [Chryseobacterium indoltheticum]|nr:hypothetical protein EG358_06690 [Chryseobacterium indoltheticum]
MILRITSFLDTNIFATNARIVFDLLLKLKNSCIRGKNKLSFPSIYIVDEVDKKITNFEPQFER